MYHLINPYDHTKTLVLILSIVNLLKIILFRHSTADILLCSRSWATRLRGIIGIFVAVVVACGLFLTVELLVVCIVIVVALFVVVVGRGWLFGSPGLLWRWRS